MPAARTPRTGPGSRPCPVRLVEEHPGLFAEALWHAVGEQAIKGPKRHQAVSGYWHSLATLARYCRVRSYLVTSRNHGIRPIDAIHAALTGRPWLPVPISA